MTEAGGSLRLADRDGAGSSFVISLPAARRSPENGPEPIRLVAPRVATPGPATSDLTMEDGRAWRVTG